MKNIKELEAEIKEDTDIIAKSFIYEHITILKDVLGLIDKTMTWVKSKSYECLCCDTWKKQLKELKKRINGTNT